MLRLAAALSAVFESHSLSSSHGVLRNNDQCCSRYTLMPPKKMCSFETLGSSVSVGVYRGSRVTSCPCLISVAARTLSRRHVPQYMPAAPPVSWRIRIDPVVRISDGFRGQAIGLVQNFDDVRDALAAPPTLYANAELQHATRIRGYDTCGARRVHKLHFLLEERHRHVGMKHVVDARAAAARIGRAHLFKRESRHGEEQLARSGADALPVCEMARILIRDRDRQLAHRRRGSDRGEKFVHVLDQPGELVRAGVVLE